MGTLLLTDGANPDCVRQLYPGPGTRLRSYAHTAHLDRQLASGACPDANAALSLRAQTLIGANARLKLASYISRLTDEARRPPAPLVPGVPICRRNVVASRQTLLELAQRLVGNEPVDARGVAYARVLLTSIDGPLYDARVADRLEQGLLAAIAALDPDPWASSGATP